MTASNGPTELHEHWRAFLRKNLDARAIVDGTIARTALTEDDVLFFLVGVWAVQNWTEEQQREFYRFFGRVTVN
jgi:hypothetical protein